MPEYALKSVQYGVHKCLARKLKSRFLKSVQYGVHNNFLICIPECILNPCNTEYMMIRRSLNEVVVLNPCNTEYILKSELTLNTLS